MANSVQDQQPVTSAQKPDIPDSLPPTMNNPLPTINKHGLLPRLGPRQFMALLAIVAIFLVIGFFVFDKDLKFGGKVASNVKGLEKDRILGILKTIDYGYGDMANDAAQLAVDANLDDPKRYYLALISIKSGCSNVKTTEDKDKLKQAYDLVLNNIDKGEIAKSSEGYKEATLSPYIWYCEQASE